VFHAQTNNIHVFHLHRHNFSHTIARLTGAKKSIDIRQPPKRNKTNKEGRETMAGVLYDRKGRGLLFST